jgi:hypothetical protein
MARHIGHAAPQRDLVGGGAEGVRGRGGLGPASRRRGESCGGGSGGGLGERHGCHSPATQGWIIYLAGPFDPLDGVLGPREGHQAKEHTRIGSRWHSDKIACNSEHGQSAQMGNSPFREL